MEGSVSVTANSGKVANKDVRVQAAYGQVFANDLLIEKIWKNLTSQDLLQTSLVNLRWCAKSREILKKRRFLCVRIAAASPCRALKEFNDLLGNSEDEDTIFNGIHHDYIYLKGGYSLFNGKCQDCLFDDDAFRTNEKYYWVDIRAVYRNILTKIKFQYISVETSMNKFCPFAHFLRLLLTKRAAEVIELDMKRANMIRFDYAKACRFFLQRSKDEGDSDDEDEEPDEHDSNSMPVYAFQNLQTLGIWRLGLNSRFDAPLLRRVNHYGHAIHHELQPDYQRIFPTVAMHSYELISPMLAITNCFVEFYQKEKPSVEQLSIDFLPFPSEDYSDETNLRNIFTIGQLVSATLMELRIPMPFLYHFLMGLDHDIDNAFPVLKKLDLYCTISDTIISLLESSVVTTIFPQLEEVDVNISMETIEVDEYGNMDLLDDPPEWDEVPFPKLKRLSITGGENVDPQLPAFLVRIFSRAKLVSFDWDFMHQDGDALGEIRKEILKLSSLEELSIKSDCIHSMVMDQFIKVNEEDELEDMDGILDDFDPDSDYEFPILNLKGLRKLNISSDSRCQGESDTHPNCLRQDEEDTTFGLSERTADFIRRHIPGFALHLEVNGDSSDECKCPSPEGLTFDHLSSNTRISTTIAKSECLKSLYLRIWDVEFIKKV